MEKEIICFADNNLPIRLHHLDMHPDIKYRGLHAHTAIEIVLVHKGELRCFIDDKVIQLKPEEMIFINGNIGHRLSTKEAEISYIQIDVNLFREHAYDNAFSKLYEFISHTNAKPYLTFHDHREVRDLFDRIHAKYYEDQIGSKWYLKAHIYELIGFMYAKSFITAPLVSMRQIEKIQPIVDYIDTNFKSHITLDEICYKVNYSKYGLCHHFKSVTGATIFDYINFLRVNHAVNKLKQTNDSILQIATDCGFSSPTYFNRVFKSILGCSPSVYRKFFSKNMSE